MKAGVTGVLTDYEGRVLLKQSGKYSLIPVHRPLEPGVLPATTLDRAFREDTGLIIMPVRLTGVYYDAGMPGGKLAFCFRCIMRGGDLRIPPEGSPAGFFDCPPLPESLARNYRRQVDTALHHGGGAPEMEQSGDTGLRLGRLLGRREDATPSIDWEVTIGIESSETDKDAEWAVGEPDRLSSSMTLSSDPGQPPWITAARYLEAHDSGMATGARLLRVELTADRPALRMVFAPEER